MLRAGGGVDGRGGGFLHHLLVAALQRAVALAEVADRAEASAITCTSMWRGVREVALQIDRVVAERGLGLGPGGGERLGQLLARAAPPSCRARRRRPRP